MTLPIIAAIVLIPSGADRTVRIAADEFAKYYREITGETIAVSADAAALSKPARRTDEQVVRIGFPSEDPLLKGETDAYTVKSEGGGLAIAGRNSRSVLYGVYDFFKTKCGCAWFWDGDVVPKGRVSFEGVDIREKSRFVYRGCQYFAHHGLTRFHAEQWGFDDWRRELDWCVKNRLNLFYMHFGSEDFFQLAYPDIVPYPDPAKTKNIGRDIEGYNQRTPFWSMQFKNLLRKSVLAYARERGMMHPEKIGPATHWFYRTPEEFLAAKQPPAMPQVETRYNDPTGLIWDVREQKWFDEYWRLTEAACREYGEPELFFNCGFDERTVYRDRAKNLALKLDIINRYNAESARRRPGVPTVIEGWDMYLTWKPDEVAKLAETSDPGNTILWDFTADAEGAFGGKDFTHWGVIGRFPYTFGFTLAHNRGMDIRGKYDVIRRCERAAKDDPMCKGYILWPENSHTDIFAWTYFSESSWKFGDRPVDDLLAEFCRRRYGAQWERFLRAWRAIIPVSQGYTWPQNAVSSLCGCDVNYKTRWLAKPELRAAERIPEVYAALKEIEWRDEFARRDSVDIARTVLDRQLRHAFHKMLHSYHRAVKGEATVADVKRDCEAAVRIVSMFADALALHEDFSLTEALDRLDKVEKLRNPEYEKVFFENSSCNYCISHQAEYAVAWFRPAVERLAALLTARAEAGEFSKLDFNCDFRPELRKLDHPIRKFAPDAAQRTERRFHAILDS